MSALARVNIASGRLNARLAWHNSPLIQEAKERPDSLVNGFCIYWRHRTSGDRDVPPTRSDRFPLAIPRAELHSLHLTMFRFVVLAPALAGLVRAQASTITSTISDVIYDVLPTADALPFDDLLDIEPPTYTSVDGLSSEITSYVTATAIASASADVNASPLSVFVSPPIIISKFRALG